MIKILIEILVDQRDCDFELNLWDFCPDILENFTQMIGISSNVFEISAEILEISSSIFEISTEICEISNRNFWYFYGNFREFDWNCWNFDYTKMFKITTEMFAI